MYYQPGGEIQEGPESAALARKSCSAEGVFVSLEWLRPRARRPRLFRPRLNRPLAGGGVLPPSPGQALPCALFGFCDALRVWSFVGRLWQGLRRGVVLPGVPSAGFCLRGGCGGHGRSVSGGLVVFVEGGWADGVVGSSAAAATSPCSRGGWKGAAPVAGAHCAGLRAVRWPASCACDCRPHARRHVGARRAHVTVLCHRSAITCACGPPPSST